jgi:predicted phosphohydrolase
LRIGILSDIHSHREDHAAEVGALVNHIRSAETPDLIVLAGDISHRLSEIETFLREIKVDCVKCWVPGNHDIWVIDSEFERDSAEYRYEVVFPKLSENLGWHYLPSGAAVLDDRGVAVVGNIGWFTGPGYSEWFDTEASGSDEELARHFAERLDQTINQVPSDYGIVFVTHHLSHQQCPSYKPKERGDLNKHVQEVLMRHRGRVVLAIHGHRHMRYGPVLIDGLWFVSHPFGYPSQHGHVDDGYRVLDISGCGSSVKTE